MSHLEQAKDYIAELNETLEQHKQELRSIQQQHKDELEKSEKESVKLRADLETLKKGGHMKGFQDQEHRKTPQWWVFEHTFVPAVIVTEISRAHSFPSLQTEAVKYLP